MAARSWVEVAVDSHFSLHNLPYGIFSTAEDARARAGVAIGESVLDLARLEEAGLLRVAPAGERVFNRATLNAFIALGRPAWTAARARIGELLREDHAELRDQALLRGRALLPRTAARLQLPLAISGYTDFYSSKEHATNVGSMFRDPKNALLPNWVHMPIAYNGRASSVVVSGTAVRRPRGQVKPPDAQGPLFGPSRKLDVELETAFIVGAPSKLGEPIPIAAAEAHIFGLVLMNDWSARDIQQWEYVPLGPFQAKAFATSISPWVVTREALEPFRVSGPAQDPVPLPYLRQAGANNYDLELDVALRTAEMNAGQGICRTNFKYMYWSSVQQLVHHASSGCAMNIGDLLGSGTISGPEKHQRGSLLEISWNGSEPIELPGGARRTFLEDGDSLVMRGWCQGSGYRVGFGEVEGTILAAE
jgi:fumarylacetoacetase